MTRSACRSLVLVVLGAIGLLLSATPTSAAGERAGDVTVRTEDGASQGASVTLFSLKLPSDAACQGDSATGNYRIESFLVPEGTDVGSLVYGEIKPEGSDDYWQLLDSNTDPYVGGLTSLADEAGGEGRISDLPQFFFDQFLPGEIKAGDYRIGIACSLDDQTTRYWDTSFTIIADSSDRPAGFTWVADGASGSSSGSSSAWRWAVAAVVLVAVVLGLVVVLTRQRGASAPRTSIDRTRGTP